ncbi:MAG: hypothetical protein RIA63_04805 [Cyclobacteriaceae bacterium]
MKIKILILLSSSVMFSCQRAKETPEILFDVDRLIDSQVVSLMQAGASLTKAASIDEASDNATFVPDSAGWANELEVFRHLDVINRSIYEDAYDITSVKDTNSNLMVRVLKARRPIPVTTFKVFYQDDPDKVRKIEASFSEENALYYTAREFSLELDEYQGQMILSGYTVRGIQKMILRDTVNFSISSKVIY